LCLFGSVAAASSRLRFRSDVSATSGVALALLAAAAAASAAAFRTLRPREPVSTVDALTWEPQGTPIRVECGNEPKRLFSTAPSAYPSVAVAGSWRITGTRLSRERWTMAREFALLRKVDWRKGDCAVISGKDWPRGACCDCGVGARER